MHILRILHTHNGILTDAVMPMYQWEIRFYHALGGTLDHMFSTRGGDLINSSQQGRRLESLWRYLAQGSDPENKNVPAYSSFLYFTSSVDTPHKFHVCSIWLS